MRGGKPELPAFREEMRVRKFTFRGGVHPYDGKELTAEKPVRVLEAGPELAFLLSQHIGAPAKSIVKKGDRVLEGQMIAEAGGFVSAPVFSSVSGTVKTIEKRRTASGSLTDAIIVTNDYLYEKAPVSPLEGMEEYSTLYQENRSEKPEYNLEKSQSAAALEVIRPDERLAGLDKAAVLARIRDAGIVGMGGAGFPTHVKLSPSDPEKIDFILVNGSECEPYVTCDYRLMCDRPGELIAGLKAVLKLFGSAKGVFCIEDNKPAAIRVLTQALAREESIYVAPCRTKYPEGAERSLIKAITSRDVNSRMLPADAGCIVLNVSTVFAIFEAVFLGQPLYRRFLTISGDAVVNPENFLVPTGVSFGEIVEKAGGFLQTPEKMIAGGPMMGFAQSDFTGVVTKTSSALTAFRYDLVSRYEETACINCGRCVDACPARLVPSHLADMVRKKQMEKFEENYGLECVNCGSCSWSCPAGRPLAALVNQGRQAILAARRKAR